MNENWVLSGEVDRYSNICTFPFIDVKFQVQNLRKKKNQNVSMISCVDFSMFGLVKKTLLK